MITTIVAPSRVELVDQGHDRPAGGAVEVAGRLVREDDRRPPDERPRDRDALPLAAGELGRPRREPVAETDPGERLGRPLAPLADGDAGVQQPVGDVTSQGSLIPFSGKKFTEKKNIRVIAVEPASCPSVTKGKYTFDYGDTAAMAPIVKMHTLGHTYVPPGIHAGGLRYHGMAPSVSALVDHGDIEARAVQQLATFEAAVQFTRTEGIIPAPESAHAIRAAIDEALVCKKEGKKKSDRLQSLRTRALRHDRI